MGIYNRKCRVMTGITGSPTPIPCVTCFNRISSEKKKKKKKRKKPSNFIKHDHQEMSSKAF
jgi:hypothetical protein